MDDLCQQLFGQTWANLALNDIERFVADEAEEGLTWEATSGRTDTKKVRKEVCAFANSERGGYFLLGVSGSVKTGWSVDGMQFPGDEPARWVSQVIGSGLLPRPKYDAKSWPVGNGTLVVVQVAPVLEPPCITSGGAVYERVVGEAIPVKDPARLADLYSAGHRARAEAEAGALRSAEQMLAFPRSGSWRSGVALGMRASRYPVDIGSRLFTPDFDLSLRRAFDRHLTPVAGPQDILYGQEGTLAYLNGTDVARGGLFEWSVDATWDGGVGVLKNLTIGSPLPVDDLLDFTERAWRAADDLIGELEGAGSLRLAIVVPLVAHGRSGPVGARLQRPITRGGPSEEELASISRELQRAAGQQAHEPA